MRRGWKARRRVVRIWSVPGVRETADADWQNMSSGCWRHLADQLTHLFCNCLRYRPNHVLNREDASSVTCRVKSLHSYLTFVLLILSAMHSHGGHQGLWAALLGNSALVD